MRTEDEGEENGEIERAVDCVSFSLFVRHAHLGLIRLLCISARPLALHPPAIFPRIKSTARIRRNLMFYEYAS
jgi:hypothetical protein